ncbi:MAG: CD1871A family CXXC motif-containing protein [Eubacteriales bacterium]|nr:CD1871A family CXXC motif-containing protein [Eubacteriales bacterium]
MKNREGRWMVILRMAVLGTALVFIGIGVAGKEQWEVLGKAVRICLECIGIG